MSCTFIRSDTVLLYWYMQYPNREPQYLLYKGDRSSEEGIVTDSRFKSTVSPTSTSLTINSVNLSDSALYYCALKKRTTVTQSPQALYKNTNTIRVAVINHKYVSETTRQQDAVTPAVGGKNTVKYTPFTQVHIFRFFQLFCCKWSTHKIVL